MNTINERIIASGVSHSIGGKQNWMNNNVLVIGGSGSGKTTGFLCPNLNNPSGSFVVSDTKGKLFGRYSSSLKKKGYNVSLIDLVDPSESYGYNPLDYIRHNEDGSLHEPDIKKLATLLIPTSHYDRDMFWENAAIRYVSMLIGYVVESLPSEERNMQSVLELHRAFFDGSGQKLLDEWTCENPDSYAGRRFAVLKGLETADKTWGCVLEFANSGLEPFDCADFRKIFCNSEKLDLHRFSKTKTALFINSSDHDKSYHVLCSIINAQLLQTLIDDADKTANGELAIPATLFLDDFAAAARIPDFEMAISIIRSRNISVSILLQSISQLNSMYGKPNSTTIINNCDTILYLGGGHDLETAEFIANHINVTPNTVLNLPRDKAILIVSGQKYAIVDKIKPTDEITGLTA